MSVDPNNWIFGERNGGAGTTTIYTNGSGGGQAIAVWDCTMTVTMSHDVAASTFVRAHLAIGATDIQTVLLFIRGVGSGAILHPFNMRGRQFFLANAGTITITHEGGASFNSTNVSMAVYIGPGSP